MATKRDTDTKQQREADQRDDDPLRSERIAYQGDVDPASMVISPQSKPKIESETKTIGGPGDPRSISPLAVDTPTEGTETPWRDTPPTNVSSVHETNNDQSPPTDPDAKQEDCDAMHEDLVPPEEGEPVAVEMRPAVEVFPPERDADMEPPRPRRQLEDEEPSRRRAER